jgi:hypothetical protein
MVMNKGEIFLNVLLSGPDIGYTMLKSLFSLFFSAQFCQEFLSISSQLVDITRNWQSLHFLAFGKMKKIQHSSWTLVSGIENAAIAQRAFNKFKYLNYAAPFQNPLASYSTALLAHLNAVSEKYDPHRVFQAGVPGNFKLDKA